MDNYPFVPNGLSVLIYWINWSVTKYSVRVDIWERHCKPEFIKHVFPRFLKPTNPYRD